MKKIRQWQILSKEELKNTDTLPFDLLTVLLSNRNLLSKKEQDAFLHPDIKQVTANTVGIKKSELDKAIQRIQNAIKNGEEIIVFGDYDVDGIAGTAILWETLNNMKAHVLPYIPNRVEEGYGLSLPGIKNILEKYPKTQLIITVDNGIVAHQAVKLANTKGIEVIITDHHIPTDTLPSAHAIVHTTNLCGTGVAYMLSKALGSINTDHLGLVALATVADLVPLTSANRAFLVEGLKVLHTTKRPGIIAVCEEAQIDQQNIDVYAIGHIIAPRLNAMGRIASAMDSLRLLCTRDRLRAKALAEKLGTTNKERQDMTKSLSYHAIEKVKNGKTKLEDLLVVYDKLYEEGVIGLVAGKLVETFYRPSIVLSVGEKVSKGSARSVAGFNIIEFIRTADHLLINAGGHPMAAGFTVATENIENLEKHFANILGKYVTDDLFTRVIKIDCRLPLSYITREVYNTILQLSPFGIGNPEPCFTGKANIISLKQVGIDKKHLSLFLGSEDGKTKFPAIGFGLGEEFKKYKEGQEIEIAYTLDEHEWNGKKSLQLKIRDIK